MVELPSRANERYDRLYLRRQSLTLDLQLIALSFAVNVVGKSKIRRFLRPVTESGPSA